MLLMCCNVFSLYIHVGNAMLIVFLVTYTYTDTHAHTHTHTHTHTQTNTKLMCIYSILGCSLGSIYLFTNTYTWVPGMCWGAYICTHTHYICTPTPTHTHAGPRYALAYTCTHTHTGPRYA